MRKQRKRVESKASRTLKIAYADALNAFELLVFQFISTARKALVEAGLGSYQLAHAAFAHQTADPLAKTWYSIFYCLVEADPALVKHLKSIRRFIIGLIEERNILAHTAFWGLPSVDPESVGFSVFLLRHSSEGVKSVQKRSEPVILSCLSQNVTKLLTPFWYSRSLRKAPNGRLASTRL